MPVWLTILTGVPSVSRAEWLSFNYLQRWGIASRISLALMTVTSAVVAGLLIMQHPGFSFINWFLCIVGLVLAHASNNLLNDWTDYRRGLDRNNYFRARYGTHTLKEGLFTSTQLFLVFLATFLLAVAIGLFLVYRTDMNALIPALIGGFILLTYTWPLKQLGLGELAVWLVWGPLMFLGTEYVCTGSISWQVALVSLWYGFGPELVIMGKHIDKLRDDHERGVRTFPVRLGDGNARRTLQAMILVLLVGVLLLVITGQLHWVSLITLLSAPDGIRLYKALNTQRPEDKPDSYPAQAWPLWFSAMAFKFIRVFSGTLMLSLIVALLIQAF